LTTNLEDLKEFAQWLRLNGMKNMISLEINDLAKSKELDLSGSKELEELPEILNRMFLLEKINLKDCIKFEYLPEVSSLNNLKYINLSNTAISQLPKNLYKNIELKELDLSSSNISSICDDLMNSNSIETIDLTDCRYLEYLPENIFELKSLKNLKLTSCRKIEYLPMDLVKSQTLTSLYIGYCPNISNINDIVKNLENIEVLDISNTKIKKIIFEHNKLKKLRVLYLENSEYIDKLPEEFSNLDNLEQLTIRNSLGIIRLNDNFGELKSLKGLYLKGCKNLEFIPESILDIKSLEKVEVDKKIYEENKALLEHMKSYCEIIIA
jgi:Leucine-rich repeat (LRR) protein